MPSSHRKLKNRLPVKVEMFYIVALSSVSLEANIFSLSMFAFYKGL